jgi:TolB-like protein/tetratricopeptide (TPR) repeat protein
MSVERWRRIDSLLAAALELPDAERQAYLDRSCADDDLRREVERLLAADRAAAGFLETPPFAELERALAESGGEPFADDLAPGTAVGRYRIESKIGEGGMASVYAAQDPELDRTVALKLVHVDEPAGRSRRRLLREAQALARVSHPHVVTIHDVGSHGDEVFLAMEYVRGGTLGDWLAARRRGWREIVAAFAAAGRGLAAAHAAGIVHRDFKPSNVLYDEEGRPRVADFGLARSASKDASPDALPDTAGTRSTSSGASRTGTGLAFGTPSYMAPEQHSAGAFGAATDQFAFCVALYQALYREHPFGDGSPRETRERVLAGEVAPAPKRARVPRRLRAALLRGLAVRPEERWPSMAVLVRALERHAVLHPVRRIAAAAAAAALAVAALVAWNERGGDASAHLEWPRTLAVLPFAAAGPEPADAALGEGITEELTSSLRRVDGLRVPARDSAYALHARGLPIAEIGERLGVERVLDGTVERFGDRLRVTVRLRRAGDGRRLWSRTWDRAAGDLFAVQEEIARAVVDSMEIATPGAAPLVDRGTESLQAYSLYLRGRSHWNRRTGEALQQAIDYFERAIAEDAGYALAYAGLADAYSAIPMYVAGAGPGALDRARAAALTALELDADSAEAHAALGGVLAMAGEREAAEERLRRAIDLAPRYPTARHRYGALLVSDLARPREGVAQLERARELDPASTPIMAMLATAYSAAGRHERALETELELQVLDPEWNGGWTCITRYYLALGRWDETIAAAERLGAAGDRRPTCRGDQAEAHHLRGEYEAELAVARRALAEHPRDFFLLQAEGGALAALGRTDEVRELFARVLADGAPHDYAWYALINVLGELRVHGRRAAARELAGELVAWHRRQLPNALGSLSASEGLALALLEAGRTEEGSALLAGTLAAASPEDLLRNAYPAHRSIGLAAWASALAGRRGEALAGVRRLAALEADSRMPPYAAMTLAALGERDAAVEALRNRLADGLVYDRELHAQVGLEPLRGDPRLRRLLPAGAT